jgi:hypothetical protein
MYPAVGAWWRGGDRGNNVGASPPHCRCPPPRRWSPRPRCRCSSLSIHLLPSSSLVVLQPSVLLLPSSVTRFTRRENTWVCRLSEADLFTGVYVRSHRLLLKHVRRVNVFFLHKSYFLRINKMQNHSKKIAHKGRDATGVRAALASARSCGAPSCT